MQPHHPFTDAANRRHWLTQCGQWASAWLALGGWAEHTAAADATAPAAQPLAVQPLAPEAPQAEPGGWAQPGPSTAPELLLATTWPAGADPSAYLVSEKYDGVRACWDGQHLRLRSGARVAAPAAWLAQLPTGQPLDGELWLGRNRFDEVSALVRRHAPDAQAWQAMHYMVFEQPGGAGNFAARYERLLRLAATWPAGPVQVVMQRRVADAADLQHWLDEVVRGGGEGLALHRADAPYLTGRRPGVLAKLKPVEDAEARVLAHLPGQGRLQGRVGALWVRNEAGQSFAIGTGLNDAQRLHPPPVGSTITYAWRGRTATGLPRFASLVRERPDGV